MAAQFTNMVFQGYVLRILYVVMGSTNYYRPQRSCGKVMFSQACVKNSLHWAGSICASMHHRSHDQGISVQGGGALSGGSLSGSLCLGVSVWGSLSRGFSVNGSLSRGVSIRETPQTETPVS